MLTTWMVDLCIWQSCIGENIPYMKPMGPKIDVAMNMSPTFSLRIHGKMLHLPTWMVDLYIYMVGT